MSAPPGGREVFPPSNLEPFFVFGPEDGVLGILLGTKSIQGQKLYLFHKLQGQVGMRQGKNIVDAPDGTVGVLPGHKQLLETLETIQEGTKLWIEPDGEIEIAGRQQPMRRYKIIDYGIVHAAEQPEELEDPTDDQLGLYEEMVSDPRE
jgi:hypothetical protein